MFIIKDNKVYFQKGDKCVGVEIYSDKVLEVDGTEKKILDFDCLYTLNEIRAKFHIDESNPLLFKEKKEEVAETKAETKTTTKKASSKK